MTEGKAHITYCFVETSPAVGLPGAGGHLLPAESEKILGLLGLLPITIDAASGISGRVMDLGRAHGLSAYDAAYVELALRRGLPMATEDETVRRALATLGVPLLSP
ncbi:MAG: type II toxin-antitoxin system VapC family toxin [Firmicutes bacterium]|nr:type II toxin-antitoxin system VapC family toxin [Bacillota bacterium]